MDAAIYAKILSEKSILNLKKLKYQYPSIKLSELMEVLKNSAYTTLPLWDFKGNALVFLLALVQIEMASAKLLLMPPNNLKKYGLKAMEEEISATLTIENIDFTRESVRKILQGYAPEDSSENRIYGLKKGLEYISNPENAITAENIHYLYQLAIGSFLEKEEDKLLPGKLYRHDSVYVMGSDNVEHIGLPQEKLNEYLSKFIAFIHADDKINDLYKGAIIHFYLAYVHPCFDGNGRMARLLHLWYLVQKGYPAALFIPFSSYIKKSKAKYYKAFTLVEENAKISGIVDITPFLIYFVENVYNKFADFAPAPDTLSRFSKALEEGKITSKEKDLWNFVLSAYGNGEFSTKQLERDFGNAAYATIRGFVLNFEKLELLTGQKYGNRVKYRMYTSI
ncbi:MAG: Fic family protein [Clostridia bacterium]|nr:Fic family protein [Clostridia bacterium]